MDLWSLILYLLLTISLLKLLQYSLLTRTRTRSNLTPGPRPLPVVGNILNLAGDQPHKSLAKLAKTHGPIMTLKLGQITTVVISSSALAKEVLQKQDLAFSTRPIQDAIRAGEHYKYSVGWLPISDQWRSLRKIMNSNMFSGSRLDATQNLRQQKVKDLIAYVGNCCQDGLAVDIGSAAFTTSMNFLSNAIFSVDLATLSQESAREFRDSVTSFMMEAGKPNLVDFFPLLAKIDPQGIRGRMTIHYRKIVDLFGGLIDERLKLRKLQKTNEENDLMDVLLNLSKDIDRTQIEHLLVDIFVGGTDTTSTTIEWAMAELLRNPKILNKAKAELEQTVGKGKLIQESDISRLHYLQAILKETMRIHPPAPLTPRAGETGAEVHGYTIPKGTQVLINHWAITRDPDVWTNSTTFMPERFLESEVDVRGQHFELIPFGAGRRICPGLPLAIRMVPLVLGSLINSFDWKLGGGIAPGELNMEEKCGFTLKKAQHLLAIPCDN